MLICILININYTDLQKKLVVIYEDGIPRANGREANCVRGRVVGGGSSVAGCGVSDREWCVNCMQHAGGDSRALAVCAVC